MFIYFWQGHIIILEIYFSLYFKIIHKMVKAQLQILQIICNLEGPYTGENVTTFTRYARGFYLWVEIGV